MHEIKTVDVNGVKLAYREYGSGDRYLLSTQNFFFKDSHMHKPVAYSKSQQHTTTNLRN